MDINSITTFINSTGFPIACVIGCIWLYVKQISPQMEKQTEVIEKLRGTLEENTLALAKILEHFKSDDN